MPNKPVKFHKERIFRETPGVHFSDTWVEGQNGLDLVVHHGYAVSPPFLDDGSKQFYAHRHQVDNNRVIKGARVFELVATEGQLNDEHYFVYLDEHSGALEIPVMVYHRSVSCESGSILLNHAVRDDLFSEDNEFHPDNQRDNLEIARILAEDNATYLNKTRAEIEFFIENGRLPE
ncbi:hemagglutinin domain-containing protein [Synechococcus phage S-B68]|nr:hemagglutinin domain-containing protein [Synechococcus phage S-B68]